MKLLKTAAAAGAALTLTLGLSACGGGDSRPSVEEISTSLQSEDSVIPVPEAAADCVAQVFHDSDLSNAALQAMVEQDEDYDASKKDEEALDGLENTMIEECADQLAQQ
ncbi:hypothetical protein [Aeromicrobium phragmitis]|nr:hypothetical protein [Aeromicrobium phragmitis]